MSHSMKAEAWTVCKSADMHTHVACFLIGAMLLLPPVSPSFHAVGRHGVRRRQVGQQGSDRILGGSAVLYPLHLSWVLDFAINPPTNRL